MTKIKLTLDTENPTLVATFGKELIENVADVYSYEALVKNPDYIAEEGKPTMVNPNYVPAVGSEFIMKPGWERPEDFDELMGDYPTIKNPDYVEAVGELHIPNPDYVEQVGEELIENPESRVDFVTRLVWSDGVMPFLLKGVKKEVKAKVQEQSKVMEAEQIAGAEAVLTGALTIETE